MKAAAIYARVSTKGQARDGTSLSSQMEACQQFARENGYKVAAEFEEDISGTVLNRPALDKVRDLVEGGHVQAVICYDPDRLTRRMGHMALLQEEFERFNVELLFATGSNSGSDEDRLTLNLRAAIAEYERGKILERTRRGLHSRAKQGRVLSGWMSPYGYRYVKGEGRFELVEEEAIWVPRMFEWLVNEHSTLAEISRRLHGRARTRRGAPCWRTCSIRAILLNSVYTGTWYYNKTEGVLPKQRRNPKAPVPKNPKSTRQLKSTDQWIAVPVPALVSQEIYEAAKQQLTRNKEMSRRNSKYPYLLRRMLSCAQCGRKLKCRPVRGGEYHQYICPGHDDPILKQNCRCPYLTAEKLEAAIWALIMEKVSDPETIRIHMQDQQQDNQQEGRRDDTDIQALQARSAACKLEKEKLLDVYLSDGINRALFDSRMRLIAQREKSIEEAKSELQKRVEGRERARASMQALEHFVSQVQLGIPHLEFEDKRRFLEDIDLKLVVHEDRIVMSGLLTNKLVTTTDTNKTGGELKAGPEAEAENLYIQFGGPARGPLAARRSPRPQGRRRDRAHAGAGRLHHHVHAGPAGEGHAPHSEPGGALGGAMLAAHPGLAPGEVAGAHRRGRGRPPAGQSGPDGSGIERTWPGRGLLPRHHGRAGLLGQPRADA